MFAIVCVSENWGIGKDGALLFRIKEDLQRFRELTLDKTVVMGRKTLQSLPGGKGLPQRRNIVLTGNRAFTAENAEVCHFPVEAVLTAGEEAAIIGGGEVYRLFLPLCHRVYVTRVFAAPPADTFFPNLDEDPRWQVERESEIFEKDGLRWQYVDYLRRQEDEDDELLTMPAQSGGAAEFYPPADFTEYYGF